MVFMPQANGSVRNGLIREMLKRSHFSWIGPYGPALDAKVSENIRPAVTCWFASGLSIPAPINPVIKTGCGRQGRLRCHSGNQ